eukprot:TRINITY_DN68116_c6_g2_i1.p1 TRINITY_DN68116_c6_g2~~TRINITY_DN68116_c6_g2_i1.p1  ORF type:complete len:772 (+),score=99.95 TRINITY_DN68116_c6_g2_i1:99-2414(+)
MEYENLSQYVSSSDSSVNTSLGSLYSPEKEKNPDIGHGRAIESSRVKLREMGIIYEREETERSRRLAELRGSIDTSTTSAHIPSSTTTPGTRDDVSPPRGGTTSYQVEPHTTEHPQRSYSPDPSRNPMKLDDMSAHPRPMTATDHGHTTQQYSHSPQPHQQRQQQQQQDNRYSMSKNILLIDPHGVRMEPLEDLLTRYEKSGATASASIARSERAMADRSEFALNSVCSPASFKLVENDKHASPVEGTIPLAGQVVDYLNHKFRKDPRLVHDNPERFANWVLRLCTEFSAIIKEEPVFLRLRSPVYILGDIHGNFADLNYYLTQLIPFGHLKYCSNQFLFLGDYVDRGAFGVEVVACLFALKCLAPQSVWLLRGNHELFTINGDQQHYGEGSFKTQCLRRFGPQLGDDVWVAVNEAFKLLPLAASVDDKIFCAHGGIPRYKGGEDIRMRLLGDPNFPRFNSTHPQPGDSNQRRTYREVAMDLLWSDPSDDELGLDGFGFGPNARGPNTYTFGNKAIEEFLHNHGYEYIVRAHELKQDGLRICKHAKVLTVFTSSGYCGGDNSSGAVFVGNGKLRLISVSTSSSGSLNHAFVGPVSAPPAQMGVSTPAAPVAPIAPPSAISPSAATHTHAHGSTSPPPTHGRTSPTQTRPTSPPPQMHGRTSPTQTRERPSSATGYSRDNSMGPTGRATGSRSTAASRDTRTRTTTHHHDDSREGAMSPTASPPRRSPPRSSPTRSSPTGRVGTQRPTSSSGGGGAVPQWNSATGSSRHAWH